MREQRTVRPGDPARRSSVVLLGVVDAAHLVVMIFDHAARADSVSIDQPGSAKPVASVKAAASGATNAVSKPIIPKGDCSEAPPAEDLSVGDQTSEVRQTKVRRAWVVERCSGSVSAWAPGAAGLAGPSKPPGMSQWLGFERVQLPSWPAVTAVARRAAGRAPHHASAPRLVAAAEPAGGAIPDRTQVSSQPQSGFPNSSLSWPQKRALIRATALLSASVPPVSAPNALP